MEPLAAGARFCPACGSPTQERPIQERQRRTCPGCGWVDWRNAKPCAGALVVRNGKVLLIRRTVEPFRGYWDIPGGFCEAEEHPAEAASREVREETGLEIELTGLLGLWMDEYAGQPTLNVYYLARPLTHCLHPGDDADRTVGGGAAWFAPRALPAKIAFANGRQALAAWAAGDETPVHLRGRAAGPLPTGAIWTEKPACLAGGGATTVPESSRHIDTAPASGYNSRASGE